VLAAAKFLNDRFVLGNDLDATQDWARMLRSVAAGPDAMPETRQARQLMKSWRGWTGMFDHHLRWAYWQRSFEASSLPIDDPRRERAWQLAIELWPEHRLAPLMAANDAARRQDWAALSLRLTALRQAQMLVPALRAGQLALGGWQAHAGLLALLTDMLGPAQARRDLAANAGTDPVLVAALPQAVPLPRAVIQLNDQGSGRSAKLVLDGLAMTETEVTEAQWQACVDWQGCKPLDAARRLGPEYPVAGIPSTRVRDYPRWLSAMTGQRWRLPTAIEWQFAASAQGGDTAAGGTLQAQVGGAEGPKPVRSFPPNALGLFDMLGNVAEYAQPCAVQPADAAGGAPRVACDAVNVRLELRGGSWLSPVGSVDAARAELEPTFEDVQRQGTPPTAGLRLVREGLR
jgi:formylglycine-generating enzyme required for sulfatase activity